MPQAETMAIEITSELRARLGRISLFLCDVDGVLTDATVFVQGGGAEFKAFNIQDGLGLVNLRRHGVKVGWISSRYSASTDARAKELQIDFLEYATSGKVAAVETIREKARVTWTEVCYAGDDLVDLAPLRRVGAAIAVANAVDEVKAAAHYVTLVRGGAGAVREISDLILKSQGKWDQVLAGYSY